MRFCPPNDNPGAPAGRRRGFTLLELVLIITLIGVLTALILPGLDRSGEQVRTKSALLVVQRVREQVELHRVQIDTAMSEHGYPVLINPAWFIAGGPVHPWTDDPLLYEVVGGATAKTLQYPPVKTFDTSNPAAPNAWYNTANGGVFILVPPRADDAATLELFNACNGVVLASLEQTS